MKKQINKPEIISDEITKNNILKEFELKLLKEIKDGDPEFSKIIDDHFWEII